MKKAIILLLLASVTTFSQQKMALSVKESQIYWKGTNVVGGSGHEGRLSFSSGSLSLNETDKFIGGSFEIDMNTIKNTDIKDEKGQRNIEEHLKSEDFFSVARFPKASFTITKIEPSIVPNKYSIQGIFTLKGISNPIMLTATIISTKDMITAKADFILQRTRWGITYKTQSFLAAIKDDLISDEIPIKLDLVFKK